MQRLQNRLFCSLRAAFHLPTTSYPRRRLLSSTTTSPARFDAEGYLVAVCGLTPSQALKASKSLSHLTAPDQPDAVRAFLAGLGLSESDVASAVARTPRLLCCDVDGALAPRVSQLRCIGLSAPQIARLVPLVPRVFVSPGPPYVSRLAFYLSLLGSFDKVHAAIRRDASFLNRSRKPPNLGFLRQCGLTARDIAKLFVLAPRLLAGSEERLRAVMARAEELGVPRGTPMYPHALWTAYSIGRESATAKMELLKSLGWSSCQVATAVAKMPGVLGGSEDRLRRAVDFLTKEAGMDAEAIARAPAMLKFSIEGRLRPRLMVLKLLKEKGLLAEGRPFYPGACMSEESFLKNFVRPHEASVPGLAEAYAAAVRAGKARARDAP